DCGPALHHPGTGWESNGVGGVERGHAVEVAFIEKRNPFAVCRFNLRLLRDRRCHKAQQNNYPKCNSAHARLRPVSSLLQTYHAQFCIEGGFGAIELPFPAGEGISLPLSCL